MATTIKVSASRRGKGFASIQDAAQNAVNAPAATAPQAAPSTMDMSGKTPFTYEQMKENQHRLGPTGPGGPIDQEVLEAPAVEPDATPAEPHPVYDAQANEDPDSGHAHLMHDLGSAIQEMMAKDPETNQSMSDLLEKSMGGQVDYESEGKRLRAMIEARKTPKAPNWIAAGVGSWAGGPGVASKFQAMDQAATAGEAKKTSDLEGLESDLLKEHVDDLRARGKTKEALVLGLLQGVMAQKRTETEVAGRKDLAEFNANTRAELQERSLGAAAERIRMTISSRQDVADKDRTAQQVMHMYETLLKQSQKDITGAVTPLYNPDEAMKLALNSILPQVKAGVQAVKTGLTPPPPEGSVTPAAPPNASKQSKFAQWKAAQAAAPRK
jgi:hypothetical protein